MVKRIRGFAGSVRAALVLLILIALVAAAGVVIPQGLAPERYLSVWGELVGGLLLWAGMDRVFSAAWFYLLLFALALNILVCSVSRLAGGLRVSAPPRFVSSPEAIERMRTVLEFEHDASVDEAASGLVRAFRRRLYRVARRRDSRGVQVWAGKGRAKRVASLVFHLGMVLLLAGGLWSKMAGYSYVERLRRGDRAAVRDRAFEVRCDGFWLERTDEGSVRDYRSRLTLVAADGAAILSKTIEVNAPLSHDGVRFYQSSYGPDNSSAEHLTFRLRGPGLDSSGVLVYCAVSDTTVGVEGTGLALSAGPFLSDFVVDARTRRVYSRGNRHRNPAVRVVMTRDSDTVFGHWVFSRYPDRHIRGSDYRVSFLDYEPGYYTGIGVKSDPGAPLVRGAIVLMSGAVFFVFSCSRRSIRVYVEPREGGGSRGVIGATAAGSACIDEEIRTICAVSGGRPAAPGMEGDAADPQPPSGRRAR